MAKKKASKAIKKAAKPMVPKAAKPPKTAKSPKSAKPSKAAKAPAAAKAPNRRKGAAKKAAPPMGFESRTAMLESVAAPGPAAVATNAAAAPNTPVPVQGVSLEVVINQNRKTSNGIRTREILIQATDANSTLYRYVFNDQQADSLALAKRLLESIVQNSVQIPWTFQANGQAIVGPADLP